MAAVRPHLHILVFVVVNWAASEIVYLLQQQSHVVMLLLCFVLEHSFETIGLISGHLWWIMMGCFHICVLSATL